MGHGIRTGAVRWQAAGGPPGGDAAAEGKRVCTVPMNRQPMDVPNPPSRDEPNRSVRPQGHHSLGKEDWADLRGVMGTPTRPPIPRRPGVRFLYERRREA